ncbi:MAG TPA: DUF4881 domain-containing protein [Syntrophobacter fumaroxidans]|nr:DUF4881 domain-containing protein [Syntrophobacter fumaroxidans]
MAKNRTWIYALLFILPLVFASGCSEYSKVDQGRAIALDKEKRTVTIIRDEKADPQNPDYSHLPPMTYSLPTDPAEMGPEPKVGLRMSLDAKSRQITIFDPASQNFKTITYTLIEEKDNVGRNDPLVFNEAENKAKKFPSVDREKKTISLYSGRQKIFITFSLPDEYFALPDHTWDAGDEVRMTYKEPGKALRFMNISRTDIYKK